jgi:transcriptional regulator with XRE-family HTH domain
MDDVQVGSVIRAVRIRRGLRQSDVAALAGVSHATVSLVERGLVEGMTLRALRRVASATGVSLPLAPRWRGAELAKLIDEQHALLVGEVVARLTAMGWQVEPEHTFSWRGERGSIDVLGWLPSSRALLVVEVKTRVVDLQDLLSAIDRKRRLAPLVSNVAGWRPTSIGVVLVLPADTWARNVLTRFEPLFRTALPARTLEVRSWLRAPTGGMRGVWLLPNSSSSSTTCRRGGGLRVRKRPDARPGPGARSFTRVAAAVRRQAAGEKDGRPA